MNATSHRANVQTGSRLLGWLEGIFGGRMAARRTVAQLAQEASLDVDEALVSLWDAGFDTLLRATDAVPASQVARARKALGLASQRELNSVAYWLNRLDLTEADLRERLAAAGLPLSSGSRTLPKGGIAFMRRFERQGDFVREIAMHESKRSGPAERSHKPEPPPFEWRHVGKVRDLKYLSAGEVRNIHQQLFDDFLSSNNPIDTPGARSEDLLESACARPLTSIGESLKYATAESSSCALAHSIVNNHPFWNGNKRTALVAYLVALDENGLVTTCSDEELFRFILLVAQHRIVPREWSDRNDREVLAMAEWTRANTRAIGRGERIVKWHELCKVLANYGAVCEQARNVGNRMNVTRVVNRRGPFGIGTRSQTLSVQIGYGDDGREVDRNALRKLRSTLELDDEHGVDSAAFYSGEARPVGDFILKYRRILRRLARL